MNKKVLSILLVTLFAILLLVSCGGKKDDRTACEREGHTFVAADCTSARTCSVCGETDGAALGHEYTEIVTDAAHMKEQATDCTEKNTYWYDCSRCDAIAGEDSLALDRWYTSNEIGEHNVSADLASDGESHYRECINDGCDYTEGREPCSGGVATCQGRAECSTCGNLYGTVGGHSFDETEWGYIGEDGHSRVCSLCSEKAEIIPHTPSHSAPTEEADVVCTSCNYVIAERLPHTHTPATDFEYNATHHWHDCVKNDGQEYERAEHSFDNDCDTDCNGGCGYVRAITHDFSLLKKDGNGHWYECSVCHTEKTGSRVAHTYKSEVTVKPKTFTEGLAVHTCTCGESYNEVLPATKTLKILGIGNSFAIDAFTHLYIVAKAAGVENIQLGYLHVSGCTLEMHYNQMINGEKVYTFGISDPSAGKTVNYSETVTAAFALEYADWDYITLQQGSHDSGIASTYARLNDIISYVREYNDHAELFWHMTWAYQADSTHSGFSNYNRDQLTMYNAIVGAVKSEILTNPSIVGVIPAGTTVQNLRNSHLGDTLTRDGYHLTTGIGRYAAALTYLVAVTGYDVSGFNPTGLASDVQSHIPCIKEAVANAVLKPYEITPSVDYPYVPEEPEDVYNSTTSPLTEGDREYLAAQGRNPDEYVVLDLVFKANAYYDSRSWFTSYTPGSSSAQYNKFLATQVIAKREIPNGSLIRVDDGYQYRPEGWAEGVYNDNTTRPGYNTAMLVEVDDAWWGGFEYRGFNLMRNSGTITIDEQSALRIYIFVGERNKEAELTEADRTYILSLGLNPDEYMVYEFDYTVNGFYDSTRDALILTTHTTLSPKFIATEMFTKDILTSGSVIRISSGYQYRPDAWASLETTTAKADRPGNVTAETVIIDDAWWGEFNYRGFNISATDNHKMTEGEQTALRIYVKIA